MIAIVPTASPSLFQQVQETAGRVWHATVSRVMSGIDKVSFGFEIDKQWAIFASEIIRNPGKNSFVVEVRMNSANIAKNASLPVLRERRLFTFDYQTTRFVPISATAVEASFFWLNDQHLVVLSTFDMGSPQLAIWDDGSKAWESVKIETPDCLRKVGTFDSSHLLLEHDGCKDRSANGYYLYKINRASNTSIPMKLMLMSQ